jgi:ribonuclease HI
MCIYTDGSSIDDKVGAAAHNSTSNETSKTHLGSQAHFNIFAAELEGFNLAVKQWYSSRREYPACHIFADSQAACKALGTTTYPGRQSGQYLIKEILDHLDRTVHHHPRRKLSISWIPGHKDIDGNEQADEAAKDAAKNPLRANSPSYPPLKSSLKQQIHAATTAAWSDYWQTQTATASHLRRIVQDAKVTSGPKLYYGIENRSTSAKLTQLRTGHCGLNSYLHRFNLAESADCECGEGPETVEHLVMVCKKYVEQRKVLRKEVGFGKMKMKYLLGDIKVVKHTMEFIINTERFIY